MATKYDQSSATRPVSICSHTSAFQVHFKHTSSALEMSSVNPPNLSHFFTEPISSREKELSEHFWERNRKRKAL